MSIRELKDHTSTKCTISYCSCAHRLAWKYMTCPTPSCIRRGSNSPHKFSRAKSSARDLWLFYCALRLQWTGSAGLMWTKLCCTGCPTQLPGRLKSLLMKTCCESTRTSLGAPATRKDLQFEVADTDSRHRLPQWQILILKRKRGECRNLSSGSFRVGS